MKRILVVLLSLSAIVSARAQFTAGNLAVTRVGDGTTTMNGLGNNVSVLEYTTLGVLANTYNFATAGADAFLMTGNATAEGALSLSADQQSLTLAGYNTAPLGSGTLASSTAAAVPRAVGQISLAGVVSVPVKSTTAFSANSFRSAATDGANNYWAQGVGSGVRYMGNNAAEATIETAQATLRVLNNVAGSLYFTANTAVYSVPAVNAGPNTPTTIISTAGTGTGTASSYDFAFNAGLTLAYIADDRTIALGGGIQRWDLISSVWTLSYTLNPGGTGARGLAVDFSGADPVIYATTTETANNRLVTITDTGVSSASTDLASSGLVRAFRGLDFAPSAVPEPASCALLGLGAAALLIFRRRK